MATVDSGTETLFSDDSPCDLGSPMVCSREEAGTPAVDVGNDVNGRLAPPNIQPYSGVLEKGKILIRPIAFKPAVLNPSARFGVAGERYGSTPILTRPGSRLTLYGSSNDLRQININAHNYSLDRKLRSSCQSVASSPPIAMSSLTSLPRKLINYDSLESVRKSPTSTIDGSIMNKNPYRMVSASGGSLLDLTPSPSDSGVSELEAALRDRDSELAYLRQTMEHNEQVIFRVYQEKERSWEREIRRLKSIHENGLRASSQKVFKMEQMLMVQNYQFQQEKKRICAEQQRASCQNERLAQEVKGLRERLEETEWGLCQKTGEISLLKSQLKDFQSEQTTKGHELLQIRNDYRDVREMLEERETEMVDLKSGLLLKNKEVDALREQLRQRRTVDLEDDAAATEKSRVEADRLRREIEDLREELAEVSMSEYEGLESGRSLRNQKIADSEADSQRLTATTAISAVDLEKLRRELEERNRAFENERHIWRQEKEKVLRYQRQLQMNYVQMYRRTRALEAEVDSLTIELELDKTGMKKPVVSELNQTIEL